MEIVDLYDRNRVKLDKTHKRGKKMPKDTYRVVVHLCLFNSKGQMLIQQRQKDKKGWSNLWDLTVGGSPITGETSWEGIQREAREELGLDIDFSEIRPMITHSFPFGFDDYYVVKMDVDLKELVLQEEEVQDAKWASRDQVLEMIDKGSFIPYTKEFIELMFYFKNRNNNIYEK